MLARQEQAKLEREGFIGQAVRRTEDHRLVTGAGCFVDDLEPESCLHLEFLRSAHASGAIQRLDRSAAGEAPGVVAVIAADDLGALGEPAINALLAGIRAMPFRLLASGKVEAVGQSRSQPSSRGAGQRRATRCS